MSVLACEFVFPASREALQTLNVGAKPLRVCEVRSAVMGPSLEVLMRLLQLSVLSG